jgi:hypothetical protein
MYIMYYVLCIGICMYVYYVYYVCRLLYYYVYYYIIMYIIYIMYVYYVMYYVMLCYYVKVMYYAIHMNHEICVVQHKLRSHDTKFGCTTQIQRLQFCTSFKNTLKSLPNANKKL